MLDRTIAPPYRAINYPTFSWPEATEVKPGLPLWILSEGSQPIVKIELVFDGGTLYEPVSGVAYFSARMLLEGTRYRSAQAVAEAADQHGASLTVQVHPDTWSITLVTLGKYLLPMLQLLQEVLLEPQFSDERLVYLKRLARESLKLSSEKNAKVARRHFKRLLFGDATPYGRHLDEAAIEAVSLDQISSYYDEKLLAGARVFASGQLSDSDVSMIREHLSGVPVSAVPVTDTLEFVHTPKRVHISKPGSLQATLNIGRIFPRKDDQDTLGLGMLNVLLGGFFGSRLMHNLREDKGYTYGIGSRIVSLRWASYLVISTEVVQEHVEAAEEEIQREIALLQQVLVGAEELNNLRSYLLGAFLSTVGTPFSVMDKFKSIHLHGLGLDYYERQYDVVNGMTSDRLMLLAQRYLNDMSCVIVGS